MANRAPTVGKCKKTGCWGKKLGNVKKQAAMGYKAQTVRKCKKQAAGGK